MLVGLQDAQRYSLVTVATNLINIGLDLLLVLGSGHADRGGRRRDLDCRVGRVRCSRSVVRWATSEGPPGGGRSAQALANSGRYRELFAVNGHLFVRTLALLGALAFFTAQGARQGELVLAANALLMNLLMFDVLRPGRLRARRRSAVRALSGRTGSWCFSTHLARRWHLQRSRRRHLCAALPVRRFRVDRRAADRPAGSAGPRLQAYLPWLDRGCRWWRSGATCSTDSRSALTMTRAMRDTMIVAAVVVYLPLWWLTRGLGNHGLWLALLASSPRAARPGPLYLRGMASGRWFPAASPSRTRVRLFDRG